MNTLRLMRYVRNGLDLFLAWMLWGPTRIATFMAFVLGLRLSLLPRFAEKSFAHSIRLKFYRTAVEIYLLSGITTTQKVLEDLLERCLTLAYFARATLLAPKLSASTRQYLLKRLLESDQLEFAMVVADINGESVPEPTAAHIANRLHGKRLRAVTYASRIKSQEESSLNVQTERAERYRYH